MMPLNPPASLHVTASARELETKAALPAPSSFAIAIRQLRKAYRDGAGVHQALDGVDLRLTRGAIHGILGASGAGKTTLLRCLLHVEQPDSGEVLIEGCNWDTLSDHQLRQARQRVGVIFQHLHLVASRTVAENISLPLEIAGIPRDRRASRINELLHWFGIAEKASE